MGVECSEEEWAKEALVEIAARLKVSSGVMQQEIVVVIQPTFGLQEGEEQTSRRTEQSEFMSLVQRDARVGFGRCRSVRELRDGLLKRTVETGGEIVAAENVGKPSMSQGVVVLSDGRETPQCVCV